MTLLSGRYELGESLGEGGMAAVHRGWDRTLRREVAIKTLRADLAEAGRPVERFVREARALARLDHPGIVRVHDVGSDAGLHFMVLELLRGESLRSWIARRDVRCVHDAVAIVLDVARALAVVHAHGVVHRDLKPDNVMLVHEDGVRRVRVIDFGGAWVADEAALSGQVRVGTLTHMAPEQLGGETPTPATDVWGLGLLLFELLTGRPLVQATELAGILRAILQETPPSPSTFHAAVPPALDALVLRCLARDRAARPVDAFALVVELEALLEARGGSAVDTPIWIGPAFPDDEDDAGFYVGRVVTVDDARQLGFPASGVGAAPWTSVDVPTARAFAARAGGRLPTEDEWERAAKARLLDDVGRCREWTSTTLGHRGVVVRGGPWRDRPGLPGAPDNASWENRACADVGFRVVFDVPSGRQH
jgi:serine/threonine protein kinase